MTELPVELWLFRPENISSVVSRVKRIILEECEKRQWSFQDRPTHPIKLGGRPIGQIKPQDATNLYKRIHRARVGVLQIENADVPTQPQPRNTPTDYITLRRFVLHKAYHNRLPNESLEDAWVSSRDEFLAWVAGIYCGNEGDPRCLPFHVFDTRFNLENLDGRDGRQRFAEIHGAQSSRSDEQGFKWVRGMFHGREALQVAGLDLATGFHWDVSGKPRQRIVTTSDVWQLKPKGYVNVYPDGHIRGNTEGANRVYPRK